MEAARWIASTFLFKVYWGSDVSTYENPKFLCRCTGAPTCRRTKIRTKISLQVYWGSDVSTYENPNEYDPESMKSADVTFDTGDLNLTIAEQQRLLQIAGPQNSLVGKGYIGVCDQQRASSSSTGSAMLGGAHAEEEAARHANAHLETGYVNVECDIFDERNQNAAAVGDMVEALIRGARERGAGELNHKQGSPSGDEQGSPSGVENYTETGRGTSSSSPSGGENGRGTSKAAVCG